jgi:YebC/PmpR family DNA-binding regulatory protein
MSQGSRRCLHSLSLIRSYLFLASFIFSIIHVTTTAFLLSPLAGDQSNNFNYRNHMKKGDSFIKDNLFKGKLIFSSTIAFKLTRQQQQKTILYMGRRAAKIAATKGKSDAIKTKLLAAFGKKIIMAVKNGGADPSTNRNLNNILREAKSNGVPNDNIQRAINKGTATDTADFSEACYEAYGHGGVGIIINCLTDNTNRARTEITNAFKKSEVKFASSGSVAFNFDKKGQIEVDGKIEEDTVLEIALEADCEDYQIVYGTDEEKGCDITKILTDMSSVSGLREALMEHDFEIKTSKLVNVPLTPVDCTDEDYEINMKVIDRLLELDDVDTVEHNMIED